MDVDCAVTPWAQAAVPSNPHAVRKHRGEARGRAALEKLRDASAERGYDSTLQGLSDRPSAPEPTPEELSEFKSSLTLGFAGFLIVAGIVSLVLGGSLWEPKGFNEDGSPPNDATPAFGFTPKPPAP